MNTLTSFSQSDSFLTIKVSFLAFYGARYPIWSEQILVILEYLQLISQSLLIYPSTANQSSPYISDFTKAIIYFFKLVNPSSLMTFHSGDSTTLIILLIVLGSMVLKYLLAAYIVSLAYRNRQGNNSLLGLWRWIFRRQCRILYFLITSFWTSLILNCSAEAFTIKGMSKTAVIAISSILIALEYSFSVILELGFPYVLPTKNFLSSKSKRTVIITLNQKVLAQILQLICQGHFGTSIWILTIFNLILYITRMYHFYTRLPLYNFRALLFQGDLLCLVTSLNFVCFIQKILQKADYQEEGINFIVITWLILSIFAGKLSRDYLQKQNITLITSNVKGSVEMLLHKVFAIKQLKKRMKLPGKKTDKYDVTYLINTKNYQIATQDINSEYLQYFEDLSVKFPKNSILKLHIAKLCTKDPELYPKAINIITKLTQQKISEYFLSASLLRYEIEKSIMESHQTQKTTLDLFAYIKNQTYIDNLTKDITTQIELKIQVCDNILGEKSNIGLIFNNAQLVARYKAKILKQIDQLSKTIPSCFVEPYLICAGYHLVLNDSIEAYAKYNSLYFQKLFKHEKSFKEGKLNEENLYQDTNIFLILLGEKSNNGQIVYSSNSIENVLGGRQISYNGTPISTVFTGSFQSLYGEALRQIFETGNEISLNQGKEVFLQHKDGHIVNAELYVKIHPCLTKGLYLDMMIRSIPSSKEYLIIKEDGTIEGVTKKLANNLGISKRFFRSYSTLPHIKLLSEELWMANQAFNIVAKIENDEKSTKQGDSFKAKLKDIYDSAEYKQRFNPYKAFSQTRKIQLTPIGKSANNEDKDEYLYDCNVSIIPCGQSVMKLITLDKVLKDGEQQEGYESVYVEYTIKGYKEDQENKNDNDDNNEDIDLFESENINSPEQIDDEKFVNIGRPETGLTTNENLLSPTSRMHTNRPFLFTSGDDDKNVESRTVKPNNLLHRNILGKEAQIPAIQMNPLSSNQPNASSQNKTANTTFKTAIAINFKPKSFNAICLMFYAVILVTLFSQVALKVVSDNTMTTLTVKKDLLTFSQLRTFKVVIIGVNARVGVTTITKTALDQGNTVYDLPTTVTAMYNHSIDLKYYNQMMLGYTSYLDKEIQQELFAKDIRVYDYQMDNLENSQYHNVNQFVVIDEAIDNIYKLKALADPASQEALRLYYWIR